jgi:hypothetical protein
MSEMYRNVASHEVTKVSKWIPQSRYHSPLCRCQSRHKALQNQDNQNHKGLGALGQNSMAFAKDFLKKDESSLMFSVLPSDDCVQAMLQMESKWRFRAEFEFDPSMSNASKSV